MALSQALDPLKEVAYHGEQLSINTSTLVFPKRSNAQNLRLSIFIIFVGHADQRLMEVCAIALSFDSSLDERDVLVCVSIQVPLCILSLACIA